MDSGAGERNVVLWQLGGSSSSPVSPPVCLRLPCKGRRPSIPLLLLLLPLPALQPRNSQWDQTPETPAKPSCFLPGHRSWSLPTSRAWARGKGLGRQSSFTTNQSPICTWWPHPSSTVPAPSPSWPKGGTLLIKTHP